MKTRKASTREGDGFRRVGLTCFDRDDDSVESHWRGFSKCRQHDDGSVWALSSRSDDTGFAFGPFRSGKDADKAIIDFYDDSWKGRDR